MFKPGAYVRHNKNNLGTGQVIRVIAIQELTQAQTVESYMRYDVRWIEQDGQLSNETDATISPSARDVPQFESIEEADAWMEAQASGGHWTASAEDSNATVATIIDETVGALAAQAAASADTRCGGNMCGCQDCVVVEHPSDPRMTLHVGSCQCEARGCPCSS